MPNLIEADTVTVWERAGGEVFFHSGAFSKFLSDDPTLVRRRTVDTEVSCASRGLFRTATNLGPSVPVWGNSVQTPPCPEGGGREWKILRLKGDLDFDDLFPVLGRENFGRVAFVIRIYE